MIASKSDLGGASALFGDPKSYARFLAQELVTYAPDSGITYDLFVGPFALLLVAALLAGLRRRLRSA